MGASQPALVQPVIRLAEPAPSIGVPREEIPVMRPLVDSLDIALAPFSQNSNICRLLVGAGPRAALAIESGHLIDIHERLRRMNRTHFAKAVDHRVDRGNTRGFF